MLRVDGRFEARPDSDVDILVEFSPGATTFERFLELSAKAVIFSLLFWQATVQTFAGAIQAGLLRGTLQRSFVTPSDVGITTEKPAFDAFLAGHPRHALFDIEETIVLRRVPDFPD